MSRGLQLSEADRGNGKRAQQTDLTILADDEDDNPIQFITENGFVIVRPWETNDAMAPAEGNFRFRVQDPSGIERDVAVTISNRLLTEAARCTRGRIQGSNQFWTYCAERRLANYLMERGEFPPATEITIETLDREDVLLAIRWEKTT